MAYLPGFEHDIFISYSHVDDQDGWVDFGPAGGSYYYSRTRMPASGSVVLDGERLAVTGEAWFDHQWGDFITVGGGGWDWFAVNLDDGTDVTLSLVRDADGSYPLVYGTLVRPTESVFGLLFIRAASISSLRPRRRPEHCGPRVTHCTSLETRTPSIAPAPAPIGSITHPMPQLYRPSCPDCVIRQYAASRRIARTTSGVWGRAPR